VVALMQHNTETKLEARTALLFVAGRRHTVCHEIQPVFVFDKLSTDTYVVVPCIHI